MTREELMRPWPQSAVISLAAHIAEAEPSRHGLNAMRMIKANKWRWLPWAAAFVLIVLIAARIA